MEQKRKCLIRNKRTKQYIGRSRDQVSGKINHTGSLFGALRFADESDASEWMLNYPYAPLETEIYEYVPVEIEIREANESVQEKRVHNESGCSLS